MGLLGDYMNGLMPTDPNQNQAARQGLLQFGAALLGGKGNFGAILGQGLAAGAGGYNGAIQQQQQAALAAAQQRRLDLDNQQSQAAFDQDRAIAADMAARQPTGPASDYQDALATAQFLARKYPTSKQAAQAFKTVELLKPKVKETRALTVDGKRVMANVFEDGTTKAIDGFAPDAEKLNFQNTGGSTVALDPYTGKPVNTIQNTQSPDSVANNKTQIKVQNMIAARQEAADRGEPEAKLAGDELRMMAQQYLAGDKGVMQNLGRGKQGAENIVALRREITAQAKAAGMNGADIAAATADFEGLKVGLRTSANISARVENAISEAKELAPLAIAASRKVDRSSLLSLGRWRNMFDNQTNDPDFNEFATANIGLATAYASAMARGGKSTVSDNQHARDLLSTAKSQEAYEAIVGQLFREMDAASHAPQNVREHLRGEINGKGSGHAPSVRSVTDLPKKPAAVAQPYADPEKERRYQEWKRSQGK